MVGKMRAFDFYLYLLHLPLHIYHYTFTITYLLLLTYYYLLTTLHITHYTFLNRLLFYNTVSHLKQQDVFPKFAPKNSPTLPLLRMRLLNVSINSSLYYCT